MIQNNFQIPHIYNLSIYLKNKITSFIHQMFIFIIIPSLYNYLCLIHFIQMLYKFFVYCLYFFRVFLSLDILFHQKFIILFRCIMHFYFFWININHDIFIVIYYHPIFYINIFLEALTIFFLSFLKNNRIQTRLYHHNHTLYQHFQTYQKYIIRMYNFFLCLECHHYQKKYSNQYP
jgi:hypothetical protein